MSSFEYILVHPDHGREFDISTLVLKGLSNIAEIAFELDRVTTPTSGTIQVDNHDGFFELNKGFFNAEISEYIINIKQDGKSLFIGFITDIEYSDPRATLKIRSIIADIINSAIPPLEDDFIQTGPPARIARDVLRDLATLPNLFLDAGVFDSIAVTEERLGIEVSVNIPATDKVSLGEFIQEFYKVTGLYIYSHRGIVRAERIGDPGPSQRFEFNIGADKLISGKTKRRRPILWQKTRAVLPTTDGQVARNMADFFETGASLLERYREKTIESDGLGGKILHTSTASAERAANDLLGWRGFPRHEISFEVDAVTDTNKEAFFNIALYSLLKVDFLTGVAYGVVTEKRVKEQSVEFKILTYRDPDIRAKGVLFFPDIVNACGNVIISNKQAFTIQYFLTGDAPTTVTIGPTTSSIELDNRSQRTLYVKVIEVEGLEISPTFQNFFRIDHTVETPFIMGCHHMALEIGAA